MKQDIGCLIFRSCCYSNVLHIVGAGKLNIFKLQMVKHCSNDEWFGFRMAFKNWTVRPFQMATILFLIGVIKKWNHPISKCQNIWILNGFTIWMLGYLSPLCIHRAMDWLWQIFVNSQMVTSIYCIYILNYGLFWQPCSSSDTFPLFCQQINKQNK